MSDRLIDSILSPFSMLSSSKRVILMVLTFKNGSEYQCYMSTPAIAACAGLSLRHTTSLLAELCAQGLIERREAALDATIPKKKGWVYTVNIDALASLSSTQPLHPEAIAPSDAPPAKKNDKIKSYDDGNGCTVQPLPPSTVRYSPTKTTKGGDRGRCSPSSRASADAREEGTYSEPQSLTKDQAEQPEQPVNSAEVAAVRQALEHALPTLDLSDVRGLFKRAQTILIARGGLDAALLYIEQRGLEWTERLLKGQRYAPHAIIHLIAQAAPPWRAPRQPKTPLTAPQTAPQTRAAAHGDVSTEALPWWWPHLLRALLDLASGHRREDSPQSRTYAALLNALADRLRNAHSALLQNYQLSIEIDALDLPQHDLEQLTSLLPILVERVARLDCLAASLTQRQHRRAG